MFLLIEEDELEVVVGGGEDMNIDMACSVGSAYRFVPVFECELSISLVIEMGL